MRAEGIETVRRILCVFPRYTSSFGTFEHAYPLTDGVQAFMARGDRHHQHGANAGSGEGLPEQAKTKQFHREFSH